MTVARPEGSRPRPDLDGGGAGHHHHRTPAPPPDLGRSAGRIGYKPALDGLRGLATGLMAFHAELTVAGGGFLAVSTFFFLVLNEAPSPWSW